MSPERVAIVVYGLTTNWLGGLNYYRNLVSVFDAASAAAPGLHLHVLTDDASFFEDLALSNRVRVTALAMLRHRSAAWALRKALIAASGRDLLLIAQMKRLGVQAVVFSHVAGASKAGIVCLPWIPDFQSRHHPELFDSSTVEAEHARTQLWLRDSNGLIVSSHDAQRDASRFYGVAPDKVHVLHFAPRLDSSRAADPAQRDAVLSRHGIDRPYVFLPNQYWQHKNHGLVVDALAEIEGRGGRAPLVVSTGKTEDLRNPGYYDSFQIRLQASGAARHYRVLGVIDRGDMVTLMAHAMAVLNPSRFEGWSTGVEEAKALGKPLLVSSIGVHLEQVNGLPDARTFDVDDSQTLASLLQACEGGNRGLLGHPPQPTTALHDAFARDLMQLLRAACQRAGTVPACP